MARLVLLLSSLFALGVTQLVLWATSPTATSPARGVVRPSGTS
jgi:hypothetical protein